MTEQQSDGGLWDDDHVQFPRLLAEIDATQEHLDMGALAEAMDLEVDDVVELFDRAQREWELVKERTPRPVPGETYDDPDLVPLLVRELRRVDPERHALLSSELGELGGAGDPTSRADLVERLLGELNDVAPHGQHFGLPDSGDGGYDWRSSLGPTPDDRLDFVDVDRLDEGDLAYLDAVAASAHEQWHETCGDVLAESAAETDESGWRRGEVISWYDRFAFGDLDSLMPHGQLVGGYSATYQQPGGGTELHVSNVAVGGLLAEQSGETVRFRAFQTALATGPDGRAETVYDGPLPDSAPSYTDPLEALAACRGAALGAINPSRVVAGTPPLACGAPDL